MESVDQANIQIKFKKKKFEGKFLHTSSQQYYEWVKVKEGKATISFIKAVSLLPTAPAPAVSDVRSECQWALEVYCTVLYCTVLYSKDQ